MTSEREVHYVEPGGCYFEGNFIKCALTPEECATPDLANAVGNRTFKPASKLQSDGELQCQGVDKIFTLKVGICGDSIDASACTGHKSNCDVPSGYEPENDFCTVQYNEHNLAFSKYTLYGACKVKGRNGERSCLWSETDCPGNNDTHTWVSASRQPTSGLTLEEQCTCDKTITGACYNKGDDTYNCAVAKEACDTDDSDVYFIDGPALSHLPTAPHCYLCPEFAKEIPTTPSVPVTPAPNNYPTPTPGPQPCPAVPDGGCSVCGQDMCVSHHQAVLAFEGQPELTCGQLQVAGYTGLAGEQCAVLPNLISTACGCAAASAITPNAHTVVPNAPAFRPTPNPAYPDNKPIMPVSATYPSVSSGSSENTSSSNSGAAIGGSIGALLAVMIGLAIVFYARRRNTSGKEKGFSEGDNMGAETVGPPPAAFETSVGNQEIGNNNQTDGSTSSKTEETSTIEIL